MGMYSDLFLAKPTAAKKLLRSDDPFKTWPSLSLKGVIEFEWIALTKVLGMEVFGPDLAAELEGPEHEDGGKVVRAMTDKVVAKLAALSPKEQKTIARKWHKSAEGLAGWPPREVEALIAKVSAFAARARDTKAAILYSVVW